MKRPRRRKRAAEFVLLHMFCFICSASYVPLQTELQTWPLGLPRIVMREAKQDTDPMRMQLEFAKAVRLEFAFLADYGFMEVLSLPTMVRYRNSSLCLSVFHGRQSYEIGLELRRGNDRATIEQLIGVSDQNEWEMYRAFAATTREEVLVGIRRLALPVRRHAERALRNDGRFCD